MVPCRWKVERIGPCGFAVNSLERLGAISALAGCNRRRCLSPRSATSSSTASKQRRISASRLGIASALRNFALRLILGASFVELLQMMASNPLKVCEKPFFDAPQIPSHAASRVSGNRCTNGSCIRRSHAGVCSRARRAFEDELDGAPRGLLVSVRSRSGDMTPDPGAFGGFPVMGGLIDKSERAA